MNRLFVSRIGIFIRDETLTLCTHPAKRRYAVMIYHYIPALRTVLVIRRHFHSGSQM